MYSAGVSPRPTLSDDCGINPFSLARCIISQISGDSTPRIY